MKRPLTRVDHLSCLHRAALAGDIQALVWLHQAFDRWPRLRKAYPLPDDFLPPPPAPP